jgi:hypothetical protein
MSAQNALTVKALDTTVSVSDTMTYYRIRQAMSNRKVTRRLFSLVVRNPNTNIPVTDHNTSIDQQFSQYEGRIINDIKVIILPPFGCEVRSFDSIQPMKWFDRMGNRTHVTTRNSIMKNSLLFKKGEPIDPLIIAETESFIRNIEYVNDVSIQIDSIPDNAANVTVIVQDNWSIGVYVHDFSSKIDVEIFDRNLAGFGSGLGFRTVYNSKLNRKSGGGIELSHSNFMKTFVNLKASYLDDILSTNYIVSLERPLQKHLNFFGQISHRISQLDLSQIAWDSVSPTYNEDFSASLGYAFDPTDNDNRFVISARFQDGYPLFKRVNRPDNPEYFQYIKNRMALLQFSLFRQRYFRTRMVNSFGKTENFAYGYNLSAQFGYSKWPQRAKQGLYTSFRITANKQSRLGSLYFEGAISSFFDRRQPFEGVLKLKFDMFSSLYRMGTQNYRHFLSIDYSQRLNYIHGFRNHNFTFDELMSMKFDNVTNFTATEKLLFKTEGNVFSSLNVMGFRFLFYAFADFGWIADYDKILLDKSNIYWGTGAGLRIRNDLLVFRTIVLKLGYYPRIHQRGFNNFVNYMSSVPNVSPNFTPKYPEEIHL